MTSISDLQRLAELLQQRGFSEEDIGAVMHGNFTGFLRKALPQ